MHTCKLCHTETTLLKKSHIIPDFFYKESNIYDDKHQIQMLSSEPLVGKFVKRKKQNTGVYDKNILCHNCDNKIIGNLESYLRPLFFGGIIGEKYNPDFKHYIDLNGKPFIQCSNISYSKTKLGFLSILWRASISKNEFFKNIKLNPEQEEELRKMIIESDPKGINKYPIIFISIVAKDRPFNEVIAEPRTFNHTKGTGYSFLIGGVFALFYINHSFTDAELNKYSLSPLNTMTILQNKPDDSMDWIMSFMGFHH